ncbi:hypothetical protein AB0K14_29755 [Actinosynnema sp. NPDC050801]|uniref:hypothetical protein n=1 Tax=unclassified Actinosynnema TaxID=2637065 RepID=UPI003408FE5D
MSSTLRAWGRWSGRACGPEGRPADRRAAADSAADSAIDSVVGRWHTTVSSPGKPPTRVVIVFRTDHRVEITGQTSIAGAPACVGGGSWWTTSADGLGFEVTHPLPSPGGGVLGTVRSHQEGALSADRFSTSGEAFVDQPDGSTAGPYPVSTVGTPARR